MPRGNRTGPQGLGPGTGRGFGPCFGFGPAHLHHHSRGLGGYFRWNWPKNRDDQRRVLSDYKKALEEELEDVDAEIEDLRKEG